MPSQLFTHYFLTDGIQATAEWRSSLSRSKAFAAFREGVAQRYDTLSRSADPNEAETEQDLIRPALELLGWADYLPQQGAARNEDIPDHLLFADADSKRSAAAERSANARFRHAAVVEESKRFGLPLDARDREDRFQNRTPHGQILRYLSTAEIESESRIRWGVLTNGGVWRLYDYRARPRASGYYEADLATLLDPGKEDDLRTFLLLFRRESFVRQQGATATFLETALTEGRRYEEQVAQDLSGVVFESVFPASSMPWQRKTRERASRRSVMPPSSSSIACSSCSTQRTGACSPSTTGVTTTTACESGCATTLPAGWRTGIPTRPWQATTTTAWSISSKSSTWAMSPLACRPTTGVSSPPKPLPCWKRPAFPTPLSLPSSTR